tara:strand:- start:255 stop:707 length:453 start_codon:yes stop_codon:yes gene_type:complete
MSVRDIDLDPNKTFGIGYPLNFNRSDYGFFKQNERYYEQLRDNIRTLMLTIKGERPMNETFGTDLMRFIFEQNEPEVLLDKAQQTITEALEEHMPFVSLKDLRVIPSNDPYMFNIAAAFESPFTEEVIELVTSFNEGGSGDTSAGSGGGY